MKTWYGNAVVYELPVWAFFDANGDGAGDFFGLTNKLDYVARLGVNALSLLPFYPSPLHDDGYDIADHAGVHPRCGTLGDFKDFLRKAHARNLRVIVELVVGHTSDRHQWFQAARSARPGSSKRLFYVWGDTVPPPSGAAGGHGEHWTWDGAAGAHYRHRFSRHQPDLNVAHTPVRRALIAVARHWLDLGVDGIRLNAIPDAEERDGTRLDPPGPTHALLKALREMVDRRYRDRLLLAEVNRWPDDVVTYFGNGDECQMAFNFTLMPRLFIALKREDRRPVVDVFHKTPAIPPGCQWAHFLRNHDELTLDMCTDLERDDLYSAYAADPHMRLNQGIRRRLAPLLDNDRRRIELGYGLLFSLPGTPFVYYGNEIGMGDNIYLGGRNGVRTPMQWSADRNGGFSQADAARLYAPVNADSVYGYQGLNVEAQEQQPCSLLNWMRQLVAARRRHDTFGRGSTEFLDADNRRVLAYFRHGADDDILVVANLSQKAQAVELALGRYAGIQPVEIVGGTLFPRIGVGPYALSFGPYGFYWFSLGCGRRPPAWRNPEVQVPFLPKGTSPESPGLPA